MAFCTDQQVAGDDNTSQEPTLREEGSPPATHTQTQLCPSYNTHSRNSLIFMESKETLLLSWGTFLLCNTEG